MAVLVNAADFALLDATLHVQAALAIVAETVKIHAQVVVQVAVQVAAMAAMAAKDVAISVRQIVRVCVKIDAQLTVLVIVVDLVDSHASQCVETVKILAMIHALVIVELNVQIAATMIVLDHAQEVVVAVVRVAVLVVAIVAQVAVVDAPVNSYFNRPYGMRCYR